MTSKLLKYRPKPGTDLIHCLGKDVDSFMTSADHAPPLLERTCEYMNAKWMKTDDKSKKFDCKTQWGPSVHGEIFYH